MTGTTLGSLEYVPNSVLHHLGRQFRQPAPDIATLRSLYRRRPTSTLELDNPIRRYIGGRVLFLSKLLF
jgi:hypothetical protein